MRKQKSAMTDLSIIIINYNTRELAADCLESVYKTIEGISCEIFVVDNASSDGSADFISSKYPGVILIRNSQNLGFAAANNQALRVMQGRYALLLNSDTVVTDGQLNLVSGRTVSVKATGAGGETKAETK